MKRTSVNPAEWGLAFQMSQGEVVEGAARTLHTSGQVAVKVDPDAEFGISVVAPGDMRGQIAAALGNVDEVLTTAGMERSNIVHLNFFVTDMAGFLENYDVYASWIGEADITPPQSLIGTTELFMPELMVEVEITAAQ